MGTMEQVDHWSLPVRQALDAARWSVLALLALGLAGCDFGIDSDTDGRVSLVFNESRGLGGEGDSPPQEVDPGPPVHWFYVSIFDDREGPAGSPFFQNCVKATNSSSLRISNLRKSPNLTIEILGIVNKEEEKDLNPCEIKGLEREVSYRAMRGGIDTSSSDAKSYSVQLHKVRQWSRLPCLDGGSPAFPLNVPQNTGKFIEGDFTERNGVKTRILVGPAVGDGDGMHFWLFDTSSLLFASTLYDPLSQNEENCAKPATVVDRCSIAVEGDLAACYENICGCVVDSAKTAWKDGRRTVVLARGNTVSSSCEARLPFAQETGKGRFAPYSLCIGKTTAGMFAGGTDSSAATFCTLEDSK